MTIAKATYAETFAAAVAPYSNFCFGIDPSREALAAWNLPVTVEGLRDFCDIALEAAIGSVGIIKPQVAFFEALGPEGLMQLQRLTRAARSAGLFVIADAKRGDIGVSVAAYGQAWLGQQSPFDVNAVTAHAYLGIDALDPLMAQARDTASGVFVVVRSSNPEGAELQSATIGETTVADQIADKITAFNAGCTAQGHVGPIGAVIGATLGQEAHKTIAAMPQSLFLVPGVGAQGATIEQTRTLFGPAIDRAILSSSRSVLRHGPVVSDIKAALATLGEDARKLMSG